MPFGGKDSAASQRNRLGMSELSVKRTLVKSPPELWPEFSEVERLANHLGEFGEISISRVEPEHVVVWEGEAVRGTVELEPSAEGTEVTLTAEVRAAAADRPRSSLAVHRLIPDLDAWDRSAAEIEQSALRQTAAAQRAAERAAGRAERGRKRGRSRRIFRARDAEPEAVAVPPSPPPEPPPLTASEIRPDAGRSEPAVAEDRARAVLETALEKLSPSP